MSSSLDDSLLCSRVVVCNCLYVGCDAHMRPVSAQKTALWHVETQVKHKRQLRTSLASDANQHQILAA